MVTSITINASTFAECACDAVDDWHCGPAWPVMMIKWLVQECQVNDSIIAEEFSDLRCCRQLRTPFGEKIFKNKHDDELFYNTSRELNNYEAKVFADHARSCIMIHDF